MRRSLDERRLEKITGIHMANDFAMEKTTIIISPLIALMNQQNAEMRAKGISTVSFSGMDYKKQFALITDMANGVMPQYIFTSPERISSDGLKRKLS